MKNSKAAPPQLPEPELLSIAQARAQLGGISHSLFYALVRRRKVDLVRLGRRSFVHRDTIQRLAREARNAPRSRGPPAPPGGTPKPFS